MTKTTIFLIIGVVLAGGIFLIAHTNQHVASDIISEDSVISDSGRKMSFSEFLRQDAGSYQCVVSQYIDESMTQTTDGVVFLNQGMIRGDFITQASGMNIASSVIVRDNFVYSWTNMAPFGVKAPINTEASQNANTVTDQGGTYSWNADRIGEYDCAPWDVDNSKFEVPSSVTFRSV